MAERTFIESLVKQGIGSFSEVAGMRSFNGFLEWVKTDLLKSGTVCEDWVEELAKTQG